MADTVSKGDFIRIEFTGRSAATGRAFDTTDSAVAKKEGIGTHDSEYKPVLMVAGAGQILPGLDQAIVGAEVGKAKTVAIPKEKAFGERRADLERVIPERALKQRGLEPKTGMVLDFDGAPGRVMSVSGGRVRVDFNHQLAGQDLLYEFKVLEHFTKPADQIQELTKEILEKRAKGVTAKLDGSIVRVTVPAEAMKGEAFISAKIRFLYHSLRFVQGAKEVVFEEHYNKPVEEEKASSG